MADVIRNNIKYIAQMFKRLNNQLVGVIADEVFPRSQNIYCFYVGKKIIDSNNYWIKWGGTFDNHTGFNIQVFFETFLYQVFSVEALLGSDNCFYVDEQNFKVYVKIERAPWQYDPSRRRLYSSDDFTFGTSPKNLNNPSDNRYGTTNVSMRMSAPSIPSKLSDSLSGIIINNSFSIKIMNNDGAYDGTDFDLVDFFETPLILRKGDKGDEESISDFDIIKRGVITDIAIAKNEISITGGDSIYSFSREVCRFLKRDDFQNLPNSSQNKTIPKAWGSIHLAPMIEVNRDASGDEDPCSWIEYITVDPSHLISVEKVYDTNQKELMFTLNSLTGVIRTTSVDPESLEAIEATSADITCRAENRIGEIITEICEIEDIPFGSWVWDTAEVNNYISISPRLSFFFAGGTTKTLLENVLKNDMAAIIQKNNGLLTIRRWGEDYATHTIKAWTITQFPNKSFSFARKNYCSSAKIKYNKNYSNDKYELIYLNESKEKISTAENNKSYIATLESDIISESDVIDFSNRILNRFSLIGESINAGFAVNTFDIEIMDKVIIDFTINGRKFSNFQNFIVKEINPGQDVLTLESFDET